MRITNEMLEEAHDYMKSHWTHDQERWDDVTAFEVAGDTELLADSLVSAGAINSKLCYDHAKSVERVCEELAKRFRKLSPKQQQKRIDEALKNCLIVGCDDCNTVSFVYDNNEELYPELKTECFECHSTNIDVTYGKDKKK